MWNKAGFRKYFLQTNLVEVTEFQLRYFKLERMMLLKCCVQYVSRFGKLSSGNRTGKGRFSFQSQRRAMPKNVQSTIWLHSFHMLTRLCSKSFKLGFSSTWTNIQAGFWRGKGTRDQIVNTCWIMEKAKEFRKISTLASLTTLKPLPVSWETCMRVKK